MASFETVSRYSAPVAAAFAYVIDLSKWSSFTGYGPMPGIVEASLPAGEPVKLGARIRVRNTDGSVHHEVVQAFEPPAPGSARARYAVRMELVPPAALLMRQIDEEVLFETDGTGTRITRRFETVPRSILTAPIVWLITHLLLRPAVDRHNANVAAAAP